MKNLKKKFENEAQTRINIISCDNISHTILEELLIEQGVFNESDYIYRNSCTAFPTEILCSAPKSNIVNVYLNIKEEEYVLKELKENILKSLYEACIIFENVKEDSKDSTKVEQEKFNEIFSKTLDQICEMPLNKFYEVDNTQKIFSEIKFTELLNEIKKISCTDEIYEDKDDFIWKLYFNYFENNFKEQYCKWVKMISKYYSDNDEDHEYINKGQGNNNFLNKDFENLCKILYGTISSCALIINRVYMEVPSSKEQFSGIVYIDYVKDTQDKNLAKIIENRVSEDYKELFIVVAKSNKEIKCFSKFKENINNITLNKRIFFILDEFDAYKKELLKGTRINNFNNKENLIDSLKLNVSKQMGISKEKIIVTQNFKDIDKNTLNSLKTNTDLTELLKLIKKESESLGRAIKIKPSNKDKIISISLNQERMSVQALMDMLYKRYNGYLVELWNKIIEAEGNNSELKKYNYSKINIIIRNRKDDYKDYKPIQLSSNKIKYKGAIDFSLRSGDYNDSKKILKMLLNYGYNIVGFDSNENKIIVNVNGEISKEDKEKLIKSIKGRLEESAINCFESAFFMEVTRKKFNTNTLHRALEIEKNITIDDFYSAFKEIFRKMSDNILRYEVYLQ